MERQLTFFEETEGRYHKIWSSLPDENKEQIKDILAYLLLKKITECEKEEKNNENR